MKFPRIKMNIDANNSAEMLLTTALITGANSGIGLALVDQLLTDADIGIIYACCRKPASSVDLKSRASKDPRVKIIALDVTDDSSIKAAANLISKTKKIDLIINTVGVLHNASGMRPEKRIADIDMDNLLLAYDVNALGTLRLAIGFQTLLKASKSAKFICLSARVGSVSDNKLGGWYAYRASKAALNMLLKTLAIEWSRLSPPITCAALHPGTVSTALSEPFTGDGYRGKVFSPREAASQLVSVINELTPEQSGGFFAWDGKHIPW
jgi:NAD(P)-dependent dehydrogenase (short-subunit alcohol dehydrogenase family)